MDYQLSNPNNALEEIVMALSKGTSHLSKSEQEEILMTVVNSHTQLDLPYLRALYFPECSQAARIPTKFPVPTGLVTQKFSFYLNTGSTGSGYVGMCPQDTTYYPCFQSATPINNSLEAQAGKGNAISFIGESSNYLPINFSHGRLVGASMQISWIGQADQESGFLCSSHLFDTAPVCISETVVEEGFYPIRARPSDGVRLCYIPKDEADTEFAQLQYQLQFVKGTGTAEELAQAHTVNTWFDGPVLSGATNKAKGNSYLGDGVADLVPMQLEIYDPATSTQISWNAVPPNSQIAPNCYYGLHKNKGEYGMPNMMVCYWKGLPVGKDWLRVDVVRHFEVLPRQHIKDLVSVARTKPSTTTTNLVQNGSGDMAGVHNSTLKEQFIQKYIDLAQSNGAVLTDSVKQNFSNIYGSVYDASQGGGHPNVQSSGELGGLVQGRDNRLLDATRQGLSYAANIFSFLPEKWLDKPLLALLRKGIGYASDKMQQSQGGGASFGISKGTPSYTRLVLQ